MNKIELQKIKGMLPKNFSINGKEEFINSSVLVPLIWVQNEYHFLFEKRSEKIKQGGEICFPGGRIDQLRDKDSEETAIRETVEELKIKRNNIEILGRLDSVFSPIGMIVDAYLGTLNIEDIKTIEPSEHEVEYIFSVPVSYFQNNEPKKYEISMMAHPSVINKRGKEEVLLPAKELNLPDRYAKPWGDRRFNMYIYEVYGEIIWGMTARIINNIISLTKTNPGVSI